MIPDSKPSVIKQGSHYAVCLGRKRKFWWLIPMSNKMLRVIKRTDKQFENDRWEATAYSVRDVATKYLKHGAGVGPVAMKFLTDLSTGEEQLELDLQEEA